MDTNPNRNLLTKRRAIIVRILIQGVIIALVAMLFIVLRRGYMNYTSRMDFIARRLDDYPRMLENHRRETDEMQELWLTSNYQRLAEQAAFLYRWSDADAEESEKLKNISETLGVAGVHAIPADQQASVKAEIEGRNLDSAFAPLPDGRCIALEIEKSEEFRELRSVEHTNFLSQLQAGMPGHMLVLSDGALSIYPQDANSGAILDMVQSMFDSGALDVEALKAEARKASNGIAIRNVRSIGTDAFPEAGFTLSCAGYGSIDDVVISAAETDDLRRYGRKRTWSLVILALSVFLFMSLALRRTKLYIPNLPAKQGCRIAYRRCALLLMLAGVVLFISVLDIQMISTVNQSQDSTSASAVFLRNILEQEAVRANIISAEFDAIYQSRAEVAAKALSRDPRLIDLDALREMDQAMDGIGLQVFDTAGNMIASDGLYHQSPIRENAEAERRERVYRTPLLDENGRTTGFVTLLADQAKLDSMLADTRTDEVLSDLHILDSLQVIAVDKADKLTITAGSQPTWIGDKASDRGIPSPILYDGYEGVLVLEGDQMYCVVFSHGNNLILVASRDVSPLVFLEGIALLALGLLALLALLYVLLIRGLYDLQALDVQLGVGDVESMSIYPPLRTFMQNFMIALFALSAVLFMITNGNTSSLTYNMVRGVWVRGINVVTVTTCLMAISAIVTFYTLLSVILTNISKYLQPRGRTICHLIDSGSHYFGAIFLLLYALSMFGVETATLLGGAGVIALMFTLGANSLIADVLAGVFIIFEGNIMVGDVVIIGDFRGIVADISMRTTKLMDDNSQDIKIISNSQIGELINQSRKVSYIPIDIKISHDVGLVQGEQIVREALATLPEKCPEIIGTPQYLGVVELPQKSSYTGKIQSTTIRVCCNCLERDRENLTYKLHRELVWVAHRLLNDDSQIGIEGCQVVEPLANSDDDSDSETFSL